MNDHTMIPVREEILFCAFRYAIGRKTYIVWLVADSIKRSWKFLSDNFKNELSAEISQALNDEKAGDDCDQTCWRELLNRRLKEIATGG